MQEIPQKYRDIEKTEKVMQKTENGTVFTQ